MRLTLLLASAPVMILAACDSGTGEPAATETTAVAAETGEAPAPSTAASQTELPTAIPAAFQGRFGLVRADCTSTAGDAKGLLEVSGETLTFYESVGTLTELTQSTDGRIRGEFAFTGEGMEWQRDIVLDLRDGGQVLVRREFGEGASPEPFTYTRCA